MILGTARGMGGEAADAVNARAHSHVLMEDAQPLRAVDDRAGQRAPRRVANEDRAALIAPQIVFQMDVSRANASATAAAGIAPIQPKAVPPLESPPCECGYALSP